MKSKSKANCKALWIEIDANRCNIKPWHIKSRIWWVYFSLKWMNQLLKTVLSMLMSLIQAVFYGSISHCMGIFYNMNTHCEKKAEHRGGQDILQVGSFSTHDLQHVWVYNKDGPFALTPPPHPTCWRAFGPGGPGQTCPLCITANVYMKTTLGSMCWQELWTLSQQRLSKVQSWPG